MSTTKHSGKKVQYRQSNSVRHSKQDHLDNHQFELLIEGALRLDHDDDVLQTAFAILTMGRLGLRVGELVHLRNSWIDPTERMIHIPYHEPCERGRDQSICGDCTSKAKQRSEFNAISVEEAADLAWVAKTENAARSVPYDFDPRVKIWVDRFLDREYEHGWPVTHASVVRRLQWAKDEAEGLGDLNLYPHALRATAASYHAAQGVDAISLKAIFGWSQLSTARCYVSTSPERAAAVLRDVHHR